MSAMKPSAPWSQTPWADPLQREEVILELQERGIAFRKLAAATGRSDADPLDLLCHLAFETPLRARKERADHLRRNQPDFFDELLADAPTDRQGTSRMPRIPPWKYRKLFPFWDRLGPL